MPRRIYLPADLPTPPIYSKTNPADTPVLTLALTSNAIPLTQVEDLADTGSHRKISQLPGVGLVSISGGQKPAVRIQAIQRRSRRTASTWKMCGPRCSKPALTRRRETSTEHRQSYQIDANDQLLASKDYRRIVIAYRNGAPVVSVRTWPPLLTARKMRSWQPG